MIRTELVRTETRGALCLELHSDFGVEATAGQIVGHGILLTDDIGDPIVGVDVVDA